MISLLLNDKGEAAARGDCAKDGDVFKIARLANTIEAISIDADPWLGDAALTSATASPNGMTITDEATVSGVFEFKASGEGFTDIALTADDGRVWIGRFEWTELDRGGRRSDYGW